MKSYLLLLLLILTYLPAGTQPDTLMDFLKPVIGEWGIVPNAQMLQNSPETAEMIGFKFAWVDERQKLMRFYEGLPKGDVSQSILESLVAVNPRTGSVHFMGYQMRNDFLFQGHFEPLQSGPGFVRLYDVYYPHGTQFRYKTDEMKGMKSYRDICRLLGPDTLECTTEQLDFGQWQPWGNEGAFQMVRRAPTSQPIPDDLLADWALRTQGSGTWIADNSQYQSDQEPYDAYGLEWTYGLGKKHLKGRLYCIKDGKDVGTVWNFTEFWDPASAEIRVLQIGSDGTIGQGKLWREGDGKTKELQTFVSPTGSSFQSGHLVWMEDGAQYTQSYNVVDGKWQERRLYVWQPY